MCGCCGCAATPASAATSTLACARRAATCCACSTMTLKPIPTGSACASKHSYQPKIGSVASKVLFADRHTINSAGDLMCRDGAPRQRGAGQPDGSTWNTPGPIFGAMGGAAAYRRAMLADTGLLDEVFFMYLEDVDLAFRAQLRGWGCLYQPLARVYHLGSATGGGKLASFFNGRNLIRLLAKDLPAELLPRML